MLSRTVSNGNCTVTVRSKTFESVSVHKSGSWWGIETSKPVTIVDELIIHQKSKRIAVPLSVYSDLANLDEIRIDRKGNALEIYLRGGQSAAAYEARLIVDNGEVVERTVCNRNFPEVILEKTQYFAN